MRNLIKILLPDIVVSLLSKLKYDYLDGYAVKSYSQEGEDLILKRLFNDKQTGFYVDVGAHHPKRFSNTYYFYKRGWAGINVDAMPDSMKLFKKIRPRDISLEMGVSGKIGCLDYYMFNEPALNGFSRELSEERASQYKIVQTISVPVKPLSMILHEYLDEGQVIDFLTVDVEGYDFQVLRSNDWERYRPKFVLVEMLNSSLHEQDSDPIVEFMTNQNYQFCAKSKNTAFFRRLV